MPTTAPGLTAPPDCHLQKAVEDSHYLLAYFSRTRVDIPVDKRKAFSDAVTTLSSFRVTGSRVTKSQTISAKSASGNPGGNTSAGTDEIAKFWNAFIFLSDLAYPATIESIRYYFSFHYDSVKRIEGAERGSRKREQKEGAERGSRKREQKEGTERGNRKREQEEGTGRGATPVVALYLTRRNHRL